MAEKESAQVSKQAKPEPPPPPPAELGVAGESSDPAVHQLLAERETAASNGDDAAVKALTQRLAELGVK